MRRSTLVLSVLTLLVIAQYKAGLAAWGYIIISFVSLIYSYLWRLVKDVDDPFEYSPSGERTGAAEVELFRFWYLARAKSGWGKTIEQRITEHAPKEEAAAGKRDAEFGGAGRSERSVSVHRCGRGGCSVAT